MRNEAEKSNGELLYIQAWQMPFWTVFCIFPVVYGLSFSKMTALSSYLQVGLFVFCQSVMQHALVGSLPCCTRGHKLLAECCYVGVFS